MKKTNLLRMVTLSMFIAIGVVISPILRVEGLCPTAHLVNIVAAVFLGPWYALLNAFSIAIIRMTMMGIPPLAITGAVFGAFLSGLFYKLSNGKIWAAVLGEIVGTGLIGSVVSYPVMSLLYGKTGLTWMFYVPSFLLATLMGGSVAYLFLNALRANGTLYKIQKELGVHSYESSKSLGRYKAQH
ncbi:MAG: energy coupling factor transporter S component ThiW [Peptostreptococcaceae bacterium]|nr:energy coupling factor transporter S component ThiW [Peptostreptococcaceae bacterium]